MGLRLGSAPTGPVVVEVVSGDPGVATASPAQLTFTPGNWDVAQAITLDMAESGADDRFRAVTLTIRVDEDLTQDVGYSRARERSLLVYTNASGGELALIEHYYRSVLDRDAELTGRSYWADELVRLRNLAVNPKEAFILMAVYFFNSPEYLARKTDDATFIGHLYRTFFLRDADPGGLNHWLGQIADGMPRDILMFNFLFSREFDELMDGLIAADPSRAEVSAVMDFYRGMLNRIPETEGLNSWVGQFRSAQCLSAEQVAGEVYRQADEISRAFLYSGEYLGRRRSNAQYVSDLYNAFMRRGGDLEGVQYWIGQLDTAAQDREQLRLYFIGSPEFQGRVQAIVDAGCLP